LKGAQKADRSLSEIEPALLPPTQISKDHDKAREQIEAASKRFLVLLPDILKMIDSKIEHPGAPYTLVHWMSRLNKKDMQVISDLAEKVPSEIALKTVIWGTPEDCIEQIEDFVESGCRHFIFGVRGQNAEESIGLLGDKVVPYFREKEKK
jgi:alkanesulfonate monooxygenase SsuD/methylene tetrahydromethanopterin reductase-like flavin-dependent oxidoreductase (luciferase family)